MAKCIQLRRSKHNINFLPNDFQEYILRKINEENIFFRLSSPRKSKLGDYRFNTLKKTNSISINIDLTEIEFIVTFIHELAHKVCYDIYKGDVASHGIEWKNIFVKLLQEAKEELNLSEDWLSFFQGQINSPRASASEFGEITEGKIVSHLVPKDKFELKTGRKFQMIKKRRTRYLCVDLSNGKLYAVSGNVQVDQII